MLRKLIEDYLESITEIQFFMPFAVMLQGKGYYDVHVTHGITEFGKDVIAKKDINGKTIQYSFQIKAGDIGKPLLSTGQQDNSEDLSGQD